jgi:hypothetical protein
MPFPSPGWPPRPASGRRSIRFCKVGNATAAFGDNAWLFIQATGANTIDPTPYVPPGSTADVAIGDINRAGSPMGGRQVAEDVAPRSHEDPPATQEQANYPQIWSIGIAVTNLSATAAEIIEISFDGTNVHGVIPAGTTKVFQNRHEAGISLQARAGTPAFSVEAW